MKKTFCDICERELQDAPNRIENYRSQGAKKPQPEIKFEIHFGTSVTGAYENEWRGDVCLYCVLDAIAKLDDRPKEPAAHPIEFFRLAHGLEWNIRAVPNGVGAHFDSCDVKEGNMLRTAWGEGRTPQEAKAAYAKDIAGKTLVHGPYQPERREIKVPISLVPSPFNLGVRNASWTKAEMQQADDSPPDSKRGD